MVGHLHSAPHLDDTIVCPHNHTLDLGFEGGQTPIAGHLAWRAVLHAQEELAGDYRHRTKQVGTIDIPVLVSVGPNLCLFEGIATQVIEIRCTQADKRLLPNLQAVGTDVFPFASTISPG